MISSDKIGVVFVHGFYSGPRTWRSFLKLISADDQLEFVQPLLFQYASPLPVSRLLRRIPTYDDIADSLRLYLEIDAQAFRHLILVTHSQGGLIAQRYLHTMLGDGRGEELQRIRQVIMYACPNSGSDLWLSVRRAYMRKNPQEKQLRPLNDAVTATQRAILHRIVHAGEISAASCPIAVYAYAGEIDGIVSPASARSVFPDGGVLPGDHFTIVRPDTAQHRSFTTFRHHVMHVRAGVTDSSADAAFSTDVELHVAARWPASALRPVDAATGSPGASRPVSVGGPLSGWRRNALITPESLIHVDRVVDELSSEIAAQSPAASPALAVWGLGGLGKTAVTYEAVNRLVADAFTNIVWASARNTRFSVADPGSTSIESIYWHDLLSMIARQLNCPLPDSQALWERELRQFLMRGVHHSRILLVVDNLEFVSAADHVFRKLRNLGLDLPHKIVATTRWKSASNDFDVRNIEMKPFDARQTYDLVRHNAYGTASDLATAEDRDLKTIFDITDGNPFLIKLVTLSYVASGKSLPRIVNELANVTSNRLGKAVRTWLFDRSLDELSQHFSQEETLSLLFAFCTSGRGSAMTYEELRAAGIATGNERFDAILELACRLGLVRPSNMNQSYSIHSLLYEYTCPVARINEGH